VDNDLATHDYTQLRRDNSWLRRKVTPIARATSCGARMILASALYGPCAAKCLFICKPQVKTWGYKDLTLPGLENTSLRLMAMDLRYAPQLIFSLQACQLNKPFLASAPLIIFSIL